MPRDTFILEQDIAPGQLDDLHPKAGTNLQKLVSKKVVDPLLLIGLGLSGTFVRLDLQLLDQPHAVLPTDIGVLTDRQHSIFKSGTSLGVLDGGSRDVRGNLTEVDKTLDPTLMTIGTNVGVATTPGFYAIGDIVRIQGQGLISTYLAQVSNIVGPNLTFVDPGTVNPANFINGPTGTYTMERVTRWLMNWVDHLGGAFALPVGTYDIGIQQRIFLADVPEDFGTSKVPNPAEVPQQGGGGGGGGSAPVTANKAQTPLATVGNFQTTGLTIAFTPASASYVRILLNGVGQVLGNGVKTKDCYFSADGGVTAKLISSIAAGDTLYWNGIIAGFDLSVLDLVDMDYNV